MNAFFTGCLWLSAFTWASVGILVWAVPEHFTQFTGPNQEHMRRRQTFYSACSVAGAAFYVFWALTRYPNPNQPVGEVIAAGIVSCGFGAVAIQSWLYLVMQVVSRARLRSHTDTSGPSRS